MSGGLLSLVNSLLSIDRNGYLKATVGIKTPSVLVGAEGSEVPISGGGGGGRTATASPVTVAQGDFVLYIKLTVAAAVAVSVDPTKLTAYTPYIIKDVAGNAAAFNITITPTSGQIEGASSLIMNVNNQAVAITTDGTNLWVVA